MTEQKTIEKVKQIFDNLPYGGIKEVSERSGYPRSTVIDVLSNYRPNRRIEALRVYEAAYDYLELRKLNNKPLKQIIENEKAK